VLATRWSLLPELNRQAALRTMGVLIGRLVASGTFGDGGVGE
jgi:hypothetical protein